MIINISDFVENNNCISTLACRQLNDFILKSLNKDNKIEISFNNIEIIMPCFLRESIATLYTSSTEYEKDLFEKNVTFSGLCEDDEKIMLKMIPALHTCFSKKGNL